MKMAYGMFSISVCLNGVNRAKVVPSVGNNKLEHSVGTLLSNVHSLISLKSTINVFDFWRLPDSFKTISIRCGASFNNNFFNTS